MRNLIRASALVLALSSAAHAGNIPNNLTVTGNIPNNGQVTGEIPNNTTDTTEQQTVQTVLPEVALNILAGVLTLF